MKCVNWINDHSSGGHFDDVTKKIIGFTHLTHWPLKTAGHIKHKTICRKYVLRFIPRYITLEMCVSYDLSDDVDIG